MDTSKKKVPVTVDHILQSLGTVGRYQILQAALVIMSNLTISFHLFSFVFTAQTVDHLCTRNGSTDAGNTSIHDNTTFQKCSVIEFNPNSSYTTSHACTTWTYTVEKQDSIVSEWDLVCDDTVFGRLPQSLFIVGQAVGAVLFSAISDRFGRKPALILAHFLTGCVGVASAFSPNIAAYSSLRLINGVCQQGVVVTCVTLLLEMFPVARRVEIASTYYFVWSLSTMTLALTAYLLRHLTWRMQQLAFASVSVIFLLQLIFLRESLRWLITNKKNRRAMEIIKKATAMNGIDVTTVLFSSVQSKCSVNKEEESEVIKHEDIISEPKQSHVTSDAAQYKYFDLCRSRFLLQMSAVVWFSWLVDSLTYFSLYLTTSSLADDLYLNFFLNSLAEVPSGPLYWFVSRRLGRRRHFMIFHTLAGVCLLLATGVRALAAGQIAATSATVLAIIGKVGNTACFNSMFIYSPEIYPTNLRTAGIGAGSTSARVGGAMAPFITMLAAIVPWAPGTVFGIACLLAAGLNYRLPESEGRELPQTIEDIQAWTKTISKA